MLELLVDHASSLGWRFLSPTILAPMEELTTQNVTVGYDPFVTCDSWLRPLCHTTKRSAESVMHTLPASVNR